ncbi:MAG: hypothetical protein E7581_08665 [Ruminococcaceae bacterium]|nr:hypothetical protein [Oscillospiraceae bacterium]
MGRMLGYHGDEVELDRPDLNKCPDCDCFFASDACPLCKKICPEEMRAGNRKPVKPKKVKRRRDNGRVQFISWYHQWWFIVILFLIMPLAGLVVLFTSPHKFWKKILFIAIYLLFPTIISIVMMLSGFTLNALFAQDPVDTSLTKEAYVEKCVDITPEEFYRSPDTYADSYVSMTLKVSEKSVNQYGTFYICTSVDNPQIMIAVQDYLLDGKQNFIAGDLLIVYGEPSQDGCLVSMDGKAFEIPCINAAYAAKQ